MKTNHLYSSDAQLNNVDLKKRVNCLDLRHYNKGEVTKELLLPIPWLFLTLWANAQVGSSFELNGFSLMLILWMSLTAFAAFYFFLTGLRVTHNAFHYCLGLSRHATDVVMLILSVLMLGSLHAIQYTHLLHHKHCLGEQDVEGSVAKQSAWLALLRGPLFPFMIHKVALNKSPKNTLRWIQFELFINLVWLITVFAYLDIFALKMHVILMIIAYSLSAFFAVWTVHHDTQIVNSIEMKNLTKLQENWQHWDNSRTMRSPWKSFLSYNMFYHIEHHLFPQIPTCHLPILAKRLDAAGYKTHKAVL